MPKILLMLLTLLGGAWIGWRSAMRLERRYLALKAVHESISRIHARILYTKMPLAEVFMREEGGQWTPDFSWIGSELKGGAPMRRVWTQAIEEQRAYNGVLMPEDKKLLLSYGQIAGQGAADTQTRMTKLFLSDLSRLADDAREASAKKGRVHKMLGALGGCALALMIL